MDCLKINSNINLYHIPMTKLKTATIGVYIHRNLSEDEVSKNAILPYVMKRGCRMCPDSEALAQYLENLYGAHLGAYPIKIGDDNVIYFGGETIADKYAANGEKLVSSMARLMMSVIFEPEAFKADILEQEKKNAKDRILAEMNDKALYAMQRCGEEMCRGESFALSILGTAKGIDEIDEKLLKEHYENIIKSSVIDIYVCGECDIDAVAEEIKHFTESISFKETSLPCSELFVSQGDVKNVTGRMEVAQGKLSMGFKTGIKADDSEYPALMVMNSIYGGGAHSKLFNNVREKLSLCYYASSSLVKNKGIMFVNAGIEFDNFQKAYDEIMVQFENIKNGEISELEISSSVKAILNGLESYKDDQRMLQLFYLGQRVSGTNYTIDDLKDKISKIKIDDIVRAAKKTELNTVYFLAGKEEK